MVHDGEGALWFDSFIRVRDMDVYIDLSTQGQSSNRKHKVIWNRKIDWIKSHPNTRLILLERRKDTTWYEVKLQLWLIRKEKPVISNFRGR